MTFEVYDYRTVNRNVLITPEIRARLYHMQPGQVDRRHSHDLGHEIFLILEGLAEFDINGTRKVVGPGQMCVALVDEIHQVRNLLPDKPTIMFLSVTPHVQPTHTGRTETDAKMPPRFAPSANYHVDQDMSIPLADLLAEQQVLAAELLHMALANLTPRPGRPMCCWLHWTPATTTPPSPHATPCGTRSMRCTRRSMRLTPYGTKRPRGPAKTQNRGT